MTSALWQMARTPGLAKPRTTTRTTMRHLVSEAPSFAPRRPNVNESEENERVAKAAASRARGLFGGGDPDSSRRARAAFSQAAAAAVEDGLRKLVARANETPKSHKTGSRSAGKSFRKNAAVSARDDDGARSPVVSFRDDEKTNNRRVSPRSRRDSHHTSPPAWPVRDPTNCVSPPAGGSLTSSDDEHRTEAWLSAAAFPLEEGAEDDGEDNNNDARGALWLEDDLRAVRAAHAVARRAEDATGLPRPLYMLYLTQSEGQKTQYTGLGVEDPWRRRRARESEGWLLGFGGRGSCAGLRSFYSGAENTLQPLQIVNLLPPSRPWHTWDGCLLEDTLSNYFLFGSRVLLFRI